MGEISELLQIYKLRKLCYTERAMRHYIVLDLEWNQSTAGKETSVEHLPFEIFGIGAVKLNKKVE